VNQNKKNRKLFLGIRKDGKAGMARRKERGVGKLLTRATRVRRKIGGAKKGKEGGGNYLIGFAHRNERGRGKRQNQVTKDKLLEEATLVK